VAKKRTVKIVFLVLLVLITGVVGYYATRYISYQNALKKAQESYVIPKQETPTSTLTEETPTTTTTATTATTATTPTAPACTIEPTNILVLGIDTGEPYNRRPRSDTIMVYSIQPCKKRILEVSVPRDSRVQVPGHGVMNINRAFEIGGASLSEKTVEQLFNIRIQRVAVVDFAGFTKLIDAIGGITINVEEEFNEKYNVHPPLPTGRVTLNGQQALVYVRVRRSDIERVQRQQQFVHALYEQIKAKKAYITLANFILNNPDVIVTNFSNSELLNMAKNANRYASYKLETVFLRGKAATIDGLSTWILNEEDVKNVHEMLTNP